MNYQQHIQASEMIMHGISCILKKWNFFSIIGHHYFRNNSSLHCFIKHEAALFRINIVSVSYDTEKILISKVPWNATVEKFDKALHGYQSTRHHSLETCSATTELFSSVTVRILWKHFERKSSLNMTATYIQAPSIWFNEVRQGCREYSALKTKNLFL